MGLQNSTWKPPMLNLFKIYLNYTISVSYARAFKTIIEATFDFGERINHRMHANLRFVVTSIAFRFYKQRNMKQKMSTGLLWRHLSPHRTTTRNTLWLTGYIFSLRKTFFLAWASLCFNKKQQLNEQDCWRHNLSKYWTITRRHGT